MGLPGDLKYKTKRFFKPCGILYFLFIFFFVVVLFYGVVGTECHNHFYEEIRLIDENKQTFTVCVDKELLTYLLVFVLLLNGRCPL